VSPSNAGSEITGVEVPTPHVQDNEIVKVTSPHDNPVTHGNLCIKGRFGYRTYRTGTEGVRESRD